MCATHTILPKSLNFELPENAMDDVVYSGGFADVLRCRCGGQEVAVKALRLQGLNLEETKKVSRSWRISLHLPICELIVRFVEVLQGGDHLEIPPTCERVGASGGDHDRESIRHGF